MKFGVGYLVFAVGVVMMAYTTWVYIDALEPGPIDLMGRSATFFHRWARGTFIAALGAQIARSGAFWLNLVVALAVASLGIFLQRPIDWALYRVGWRGLK
jgi:hypothetical protein